MTLGNPNFGNRLCNRQTCSRCGRRLAANPRLKHCPFCAWKFRLDCLLWLEHVQKERVRLIRLARFKWALIGASPYLKETDVNAIIATIQEASERPFRAVRNQSEEKTSGK